MIKHTPGPWSYDSLDRVVIRAGIEDIAHMDRSASDDDARLIAAAPELLEALEKLLKTVENNWLADEEWDPEEWQCYDEFREVIAKARGES